MRKIDLNDLEIAGLNALDAAIAEAQERMKNALVALCVARGEAVPTQGFKLGDDKRSIVLVDEEKPEAV